MPLMNSIDLSSTQGNGVPGRRRPCASRPASANGEPLRLAAARGDSARRHERRPALGCAAGVRPPDVAPPRGALRASAGDAVGRRVRRPARARSTTRRSAPPRRSGRCGWHRRACATRRPRAGRVRRSGRAGNLPSLHRETATTVRGPARRRPRDRVRPGGGRGCRPRLGRTPSTGRPDRPGRRRSMAATRTFTPMATAAAANLLWHTTTEGKRTNVPLSPSRRVGPAHRATTRNRDVTLTSRYTRYHTGGPSRAHRR